jgi:hypothetical protein
MSAKQKQIIVDKDAFIGINISDLCNFAKNHLVLGCDALLYECATTSEARRMEMLSRYKKLIQAGAYYCSCSIAFIQSESKKCLPYPWFLPDLDATKQIRIGERRPEDLPDLTTYGEISQQRYKVAKAFLNVVNKIKKRIDIEVPYVGKFIKQLPVDKYERFRILFESIDKKDLHQMCVDSFPPDWIKNGSKFCLSTEWMSWQLIRLTDVVVQDYNYLSQLGGGPGVERAEHDYQDIEYVLLLSRANCLLTRDEKLVKPLAKAAFPDKDVFSSLEEVPEGYICNWI